MIAVLLCNLAFSWTLDSTAESRRLELLRTFQFNDLKSLGGGLLIVVAGSILWQVFGQTVKENFSIELPAEVTKAIVRLLVAGTRAILESKPTIWSDIQVSLVEVSGGIALATLLAVPIIELMFRINSPKFSSALLSLTCIAPVDLATQILA